MKTKTKISLIVLGIVLLLVIILVASTAYTVKENQYGIVRQFGKVVSIKDEAGVYIKIPFIEDVTYLPKTLMLYDVTPSEVLTADKKALVVESYIVWKITDPLRFVQSIGTIDEMESRLDAATFSVVKNTMGTMEQTSIIQSGASENSRNEVNALITEKVNEQITGEYGVAVYERMISERQQMAAKYVAEGELQASVIRNDTDKEAAIIISEASAEAEKLKGEGEAEYMRIIAEAYATEEQVEFYEFYRSLEAMKKSLLTENGNKRVLILSEDSFIAQMFLGE